MSNFTSTTASIATGTRPIPAERELANLPGRMPSKVTLEDTMETFTADHAGHPLGPTYPTGSPLRREVFHEASQMWRGESHRMAWERILRFDPCCYCGRFFAGTVDHIEPKTKTVRGLGGAFCWLNLTGACPDCNGSKSRRSLLRFLEVRARSRPRRSSGALPVHPRKKSVVVA